MKAALLADVVETQAARQSAVLVRCLDSSEQWLIRSNADPATYAGLSPALHADALAALKRDGASVVESAGRRYLLQTLSPPYRLIVIGAVHIAQALLPMARTAGYTPILIDPRPAFATQERFPGAQVICDWPQEVMPTLELNSRTAVVTLSHDPKIDEPALRAALESDAFFIGALGSRKNHAGRLARLATAGFDAASLARIAGPVGLNLGGRAPAEIAVAILAQVIQTRYHDDTHPAETSVHRSSPG